MPAVEIFDLHRRLGHHAIAVDQQGNLGGRPQRCIGGASIRIVFVLDFVVMSILGAVVYKKMSE